VKVPDSDFYLAAGSRKEAVARVKIKPGSGKVTVNGRDMLEYFGGRKALISTVEAPLKLTDTLGKFDIEANVRGGGLSGQAGAIRLGIARDIIMYDETLRPVLRAAGMLTRDPRMVERKKYGLAGARKRYQFSKR